MRYGFALLAVFLIVTGLVQAEPRVLTYQKENHWIAAGDKAPLRALLDEAKETDAKLFDVILPETNRPLAIERLKILRNILEQSLKHGVLIKEIDGTTPENSLTLGLEGTLVVPQETPAEVTTEVSETLAE